MDLSDCLFDSFLQSENAFLPRDLKDLFKLDLSTSSQTHDLLKCACLASKENSKRKELLLPFLNEWIHRDNKSVDALEMNWEKSFVDALNQYTSFYFYKDTLCE